MIIKSILKKSSRK